MSKLKLRPRVHKVVVLRVPADTPKPEAYKAKRWAKNLARAISRKHEKDHYYEKGDWTK